MLCRVAGVVVLGVTVAGMGHARAKVERRHRDEVRRAREDGLEAGFVIGYQARLGERGVSYLPSRRRRRRLTSDS